jgi:hypothetical protein
MNDHGRSDASGHRNAAIDDALIIQFVPASRLPVEASVGSDLVGLPAPERVCRNSLIAAVPWGGFISRIGEERRPFSLPPDGAMLSCRPNGGALGVA